MKILLYVLLAFGVFCFFSCKRTEKEQLTFLMKEWTRKEILFHDRAVFTIQGKDTLDKFPYPQTKSSPHYNHWTVDRNGL
jgi:hypothetical protein